MTELSWIILTLVSLIFSALFSGVEIAYISSDRVRVELDATKGGLIGKLINRFYSNEELFISTILVGNNIVLVIYGMGAAALIEPWLSAHLPGEALVLLCSTLITTGVILFTGEFFPKTIFRINPNTSFKVFAVPVYLIYLILYPISLFITLISRGIMHICGIESENDKLGSLSVGDLNDYIENAIDEVNPDKQPLENEVMIFHNALDFSTTHVRDCMLPRNEIVAVDIDNTTRAELSALFTQSGRSKIIVYREDIDNILGYIHVSELFYPDNDWKSHLKNVIFAPETLLANKLMRRLLSEKRSIAVVVDEFGGTAGLVTLEDLMEEICGDIRDEHDTSDLVARDLGDGCYEFSGRAEIDFIRSDFHLDIPESDDYQTIAGYILHTSGSIPSQGETIVIENYAFTIIKRSATRLELIKVSPAPADAAQE